MTYRSIPPTEYQKGRFVVRSLLEALALNPVAIAEADPAAPRVRAAALQSYTAGLVTGGAEAATLLAGTVSDSGSSILATFTASRTGTVTLVADFIFDSSATTSDDALVDIERNGVPADVALSFDPTAGNYTRVATVSGLAQGDTISVRLTNGGTGAVVARGAAYVIPSVPVTAGVTRLGFSALEQLFAPSAGGGSGVSPSIPGSMFDYAEARSQFARELDFSNQVINLPPSTVTRGGQVKVQVRATLLPGRFVKGVAQLELTYVLAGVLQTPIVLTTLDPAATDSVSAVNASPVLAAGDRYFVTLRMLSPDVSKKIPLFVEAASLVDNPVVAAGQALSLDDFAQIFPPVPDANGGIASQDRMELRTIRGVTVKDGTTSDTSQMLRVARDGAFVFRVGAAAVTSSAMTSSATVSIVIEQDGVESGPILLGTISAVTRRDIFRYGSPVLRKGDGFRVVVDRTGGAGTSAEIFYEASVCTSNPIVGAPQPLALGDLETLFPDPGGGLGGGGGGSGGSGGTGGVSAPMSRSLGPLFAETHSEDYLELDLPPGDPVQETAPVQLYREGDFFVYVRIAKVSASEDVEIRLIRTDSEGVDQAAEGPLTYDHTLAGGNFQFVTSTPSADSRWRLQFSLPAGATGGAHANFAYTAETVISNPTVAAPPPAELAGVIQRYK